MCLTWIGVLGRSPPSVGAFSIWRTTSILSQILPNTGWRDAPGLNQSRYELWIVLMKNYDPPVLGRPVLAMASVPGSLEIL